MRKTLFTVVLCLLVDSCGGQLGYNNPYLTPPSFTISIDKTLPLYQSLEIPGNALYIPNAGIRGVFVINVGGNQYNAWESACPNQKLGSCSTMMLESGGTCRCKCDDYRYSLYDGVPQNSKEDTVQNLIRYSATVSGDTIVVSN